jgi:hypothetical protein
MHALKKPILWQESFSIGSWTDHCMATSDTRRSLETATSQKRHEGPRSTGFDVDWLRRCWHVWSPKQQRRSGSGSQELRSRTKWPLSPMLFLLTHALSPHNGTAAHDVQVCSKCWGLGFSPWQLWKLLCLSLWRCGGVHKAHSLGPAHN